MTEDDFLNFCEVQIFSLRECAVEVGGVATVPFQLASTCTSTASCADLGWGAGRGSADV
eukprot:SAG22_NODE_18828_length_281_cov_0.571429_2_plen_58_part_01